MRLRKLEIKDAPFMLEWMHDKDVVKELQANFIEKTIQDCEAFVRKSLIETQNLHLAIVDIDDIYMGTVSLKNINYERKSAEFAITIRTIAMQKGFSKFAMEKIIRKGLDDLGLEQIYWCVSKTNARAIRFYDKNGYQRLDEIPKEFCESYTPEQVEHYLWYLVEKSQFGGR